MRQTLRLYRDTPALDLSVSLISTAGNQRSWIAGNNEGNPLLLRTDGGGATWQSLSASVIAHVQRLGLSGTPRLHSGFALDANNIWIGGEAGLLLYSGNGGEG